MIGKGTGPGDRDDLFAYLDADKALQDSRTQVKELEHTDAVETYHAQIDLLRRRLLADPAAFREMFIQEGMQAIAFEFRQEELSKQFTRTLWDMLLRDDDASRILMRFLWTVPLKLKRKFVRAIDTHLAKRYPMFDGLSVDWPAGNAIPPYVREPAARSQDFELVNQGYLGYMRLGYTAREVEHYRARVKAELESQEQPDDHTADALTAPGGEAFSAAMMKIWDNPGARALRPVMEADVKGMTSSAGVLQAYRAGNRPDMLRRQIEVDYGAALQDRSAEQWGRRYVAWWEVRNLRMVSAIRQAAADKPGGKVLAVVGSSHKPYFERYLGQMHDATLVDVEGVLR